MSKRVTIQKALIQAENQIVFQLRGEDKEVFFKKRKGNDYMNRRKEFLFVLISQGRSF